jgi:predicted RNA-binding protein with PIN domain
MPYLIDGHNLIPKIRGLHLKALDDEIELVKLLMEYCRLSRKQTQVFFDKAPPGGRSVQSYGAVVAHFVSETSTADLAIHQKLSRLGSEARNWTVVSSDRSVQALAKAARAHVLSSERFARELAEVLASGPPVKEDRAEVALSPDEVDAWMEEFGEGDSSDQGIS